MIINMTGGGGGAGLNYSVVGGTAQPSSASENTIWVNTSTAITSHAFSATEATSPTAGMVWIKTSNVSVNPFNALKKNCLQVYPTNCSQYIDGAWVSKDMLIYQGGEWLPFGQYFYS